MSNVRFKMNLTHLQQLLTGETVSIDTINGERVEFFLEDMGIERVEEICEQSIQSVKQKLYQS